MSWSREILEVYLQDISKKCRQVRLRGKHNIFLDGLKSMSIYYDQYLDLLEKSNDLKDKAKKKK